MKINFPVTLTAADSRKRTISGTIVTWGEKGNTSVGSTVFEKNSIDFTKPVKLLLEHDRTRPVTNLRLPRGIVTFLIRGLKYSNGQNFRDSSGKL